MRNHNARVLTLEIYLETCVFLRWLCSLSVRLSRKRHGQPIKRRRRLQQLQYTRPDGTFYDGIGRTHTHTHTHRIRVCPFVGFFFIVTTMILWFFSFLVEREIVMDFVRKKSELISSKNWTRERGHTTRRVRRFLEGTRDWRRAETHTHTHTRETTAFERADAGTTR